MKVFNTKKLDVKKLTRDEQYFIYNGLDSALTHEIHTVLDAQHTKLSRLVYNFELAQTKPALEMMLFGIRVDTTERRLMLHDLNKKRDELENWLRRLAEAIWKKPLNPRSNAQLTDLLYNYMKFTPPKISQKGEPKISVNRESLEKLHTQYPFARPIVNALLAMRDVEKKIAVLTSSCDSTGRFRFSFNVGGTESGRWSSSKSVFGDGWNAQNITPDLRRIFIPDPGFKLCYADLSQAESFVVAYISEDPSYIRACESGDLHTFVTRTIWPELHWTGNIKEDRAQAEQPYYRQFSYRDMAKRGGHGTNYFGQPWTMSKHLKVDVSIMTAFQDAYFTRFPGIPRWHSEVKKRLQSSARITTPMGRTRLFFNRLTDDSTLREAIAYEPQSTVADILNLGLYYIWKYLQGPDLQVLAQVHDAVLFQYRETRSELVAEALSLMTIPVMVHKRKMVIPVDAKVGYSWSDMATLGSDKETKQTPPNYAEGWDLLNTKAG